jgi:hypothetical protein
MMRWWKKIKDLLALAARMENMQLELDEFDRRVKESIKESSKDFEKKIQEMTFAYTKNLDDTKSDYLKRYLEVRLNCMQQELTSLPLKLSAIKEDLLRLENKIENQDEEE